MTNVASIDLDAIRGNLQEVRRRIEDVPIMAVVKADAYGHGAVEVSRAVRAHGIDWLGVATPGEARMLRAAGDRGRMLAWLWAPNDPDLEACLMTGVDLGVSSTGMLEEVVARGQALEHMPRIHLKVDTGLSRNGATVDDWTPLVAAAAAAQARGRLRVVGVWSHLANADRADDPSVIDQTAAFESALEVVAAAGLDIELRHLANSPGALLHPGTRYDMVRIGIAMYGASPTAVPAADLGLRAAMTLSGELALVKRVDAGTSVSYGSTWSATVPTRLGLLPLGYADGLPRIAGNHAEVLLRGVRCPVVGRIAMDQCVIAIADSVGDVGAGEPVVVFGDASTGAPTADDWGAASGSIGYEIVTRIGSRVPRAYVGVR